MKEIYSAQVYAPKADGLGPVLSRNKNSAQVCLKIIYLR